MEGQHSFIFNEALAGISRPNDNITQALHLFALRGIDEWETVSLLGTYYLSALSHFPPYFMELKKV